MIDPYTAPQLAADLRELVPMAELDSCFDQTRRLKNNRCDIERRRSFLERGPSGNTTVEWI